MSSFRWSYWLSIPLLVAATSGAFLLLIHRERGQIVSHLSHRAAHASVDDAVVAVRQLGRLPRPPIEPLVAAAAAPSRRVALEAQATIAELLRNWQRQLNTGRKVGRIAAQLETLAELLNERAEQFSQRDYAWLARTASKIVELANQAPLGDGGQIALDCDALLSRLPAHHHAVTPRSAARPAKPAAESAVTPVSTRPTSIVPTSDSVFAPPSNTCVETLLAEKTHASRPADSTWTPRWMPPSHSRAWSGEPHSIDRPPLRVSPAKGSAPLATRRDRFQHLATRELLDRWLADSRGDARDLERELRRRGFTSLSPALVRPLLRGEPAMRVHMVYEVTQLPGAEAKAWLLLLAEDSAADVRLAAVTVIATSNDSELRQKAWLVALRDRDPRVASLAERLRQ